MIGRISGVLLFVDPPIALVDVNGVGYEVEVPLSTLADLPRPGEKVTLTTHLVVKEDSHSLYGFMRAADRALFRSLLRISGVGAKLALTILSGANAEEFAQLVADGDVAALTRLPGIGKKTAERLIMEMKDKLGDLPTSGGARLPGTSGVGAVPNDPRAEATAALLNLGYKAQEVERMVRQVVTEDSTAETIIRDALKAQVQR
ncbi:MAG: Holliday junction branch migration protein RuvA [Pseudomonadota bacterium]